EFAPMTDEEMEAELDRIEARETETHSDDVDPDDPGVDIEADSLDGTMLEEEIEEELARIRDEDGSSTSGETSGEPINEQDVVRRMEESEGIMEPLSEEEIASELDRIEREEGASDDSADPPKDKDR
ncbi:MAG: hypothetical protein AAF420_03035, partial [Pseudomonadota bacterium]